ncbi:MAG: dockerin type I repeat-containing protein [Oscillospiraceae bacterium]|nr:dockerin type I repeat-containing protein [Oscillospiraceae bacterium]
MNIRLKKIIAFALCLCLFAALIPSFSPPAVAASINQKIASLKTQFPHGQFWNHYVTTPSEAGLRARKDESFQNSVTSRPCSTHNGTAAVGQYECNYFDGGIQCWGFACKLFYEIFGVRASAMAKRTDTANIQAGDYLRFGNDSSGHSALCIGRSGNTLTLAECNYHPSGSGYAPENDLIYWGRTVNVSSVSYYKHASNYSSFINEPGVSFAAWSNDNYTFIRDTDAAIGQEITVTGGTCTETGMYLYDRNGNYLAMGKNSSYTAPRVFFRINTECGYTLSPGTTYKYRFYAIVNGQTYWGTEGSFTTTGVSVSFVPWSNDNYTFIRETDAAIGQEITFNGGTCTETGMYLYDQNGNYLAKGRNDTYTRPRVFFRITTECGYTLSPGTTYKYKFYAVVNGQTYWGAEGSFTTTGTAVIKGDLDFDGFVKNTDLILAAKHVVKITVLSGEQLIRADMNNDSAVSNSDVILIARKVVGL